MTDAEVVDVVEVRPPRAVLVVMGGLAAVTLPLAIAGAAVGEVLVGLVAFVSALWLGATALMGWRAWSRADGDGYAVGWMGVVEEGRWDDVAVVEWERMGAGGPRRGALVVTDDGRRLRWVPWFPFLWFGHGRMLRGVEALGRLLAARGDRPRLDDPDAPDADTPTWTRGR